VNVNNMDEIPDHLPADGIPPRLKARNVHTGKIAVSAIPDDWTPEQAELASKNGTCDICDAPVSKIEPHRPDSIMRYDTAECLNGHRGAINCRCGN
jgi:hypothetical protein